MLFLFVLYRDREGTSWEGKMDLLAGTIDAPEVVDFKTSEITSPDRLEELYGAQLRRYAEGVRRALTRKQEVPWRIVHFPPG